MHDEISMVDGFSFWFSPRNSFQGAKSIVMQVLLFSDQISGEGEQMFLWGHPLWKKARLQAVLYY